MTSVVLLVGSQRTSHDSLAETIRGLNASGHRVSLVTRVVPSESLLEVCDDVAVVGAGLTSVAVLNAQVAAAAADAAETPTPARPTGVARVQAAAAWRARRLRRGAARRTAKVRTTLVEPARCWSDVRRSPEALRLASTADVICAADSPMLRAAWHLGQRYPGPQVVFGLASVDGAISRASRR